MKIDLDNVPKLLEKASVLEKALLDFRMTAGTDLSADECEECIEKLYSFRPFRTPTKVTPIRKPAPAPIKVRKRGPSTAGAQFVSNMALVMGDEILGITDICNRLQARKMDQNSGNIRSYVCFTLSKTPGTFERVERGLYKVRKAPLPKSPVQSQAIQNQDHGGLRDFGGQKVSLRMVLQGLDKDTLKRKDPNEVWAILRTRGYTYDGTREPERALREALERYSLTHDS